MAPKSSPTPLFGGALTCVLPAQWLDASDARPVPDHQEVWLERDGERSVIIEILERADCDDSICAPFHFDDLAHGNDATSSEVEMIDPFAVNLLHSSLHTAASCSLLIGSQVLPASDEAGRVSPGGSSRVSSQLSVHLAVVRLAEQTTDLLVTVCRPHAPNSSAAEVKVQDSELLRKVLVSLTVEDFGLFGSAESSES